MLYRSQTAHLALVLILMLAFVLMRIWAKVDPETGLMHIMNPWSLQEVSADYKLLSSDYLPYIFIGALIFAASGLATQSILKHGDRPMQLKLGRLNTLVLLLMIVIMVYLVRREEAIILPEVPGQYKLGAWVPVVALISNLRASYLIWQDEKTVKDADRMR